ncbi:MAG: RsmE family RNA methyltransferase [Nitriliruptor sp.]
MSLAPYVHLDEELAAARAGDRIALGADATHHLTRVLRLRPGARLVVADGRGGRATARFDEGAVVLHEDATVLPAARPALTVAQALPKGRKLDEVLRQVTELGVDRFVPVAAERSQVKLDAARAAKAVDRWGAIVRAASEQARRPWRPAVLDVTATADLSAVLDEGGRLLVAHLGAERSLVEVARDVTGAAGVTVAIGPEGGWSDDEVASLVGGGAEAVGLGPTVLRTEHAAAAAVAVLAAVTGRWG